MNLSGVKWGKCIKMSPNKDSVGSVVLITKLLQLSNIIEKKIHFLHNHHSVQSPNTTQGAKTDLLHISAISLWTHNDYSAEISSLQNTNCVIWILCYSILQLRCVVLGYRVNALCAGCGFRIKSRLKFDSNFFKSLWLSQESLNKY